MRSNSDAAAYDLVESGSVDKVDNVLSSAKVPSLTGVTGA